MDVALDRADHHLAQLGRAGLGQQRPQKGHAALHGVGSQQDFRHEEDAVAEVDADDPHAFHQRLGQDVVRSPAALQQDLHTLFDLFFQAVIEIVMHLFDEFVVIQCAKVEIVFIRHGFIP